MAFVDHDLHIHSYLSPCAGEAGRAQTTARILSYAEESGFHTIALTDHFWDENVPGAEDCWYERQNFAHIASARPLPQSDKVRFLFGCECELGKDLQIAVSPARMDAFDFIIIPTNHLHLSGITCRGDEDMPQRAKLWCDRLDYVLEQDLPFHKIGIAHLTDTGIMAGRAIWTRCGRFRTRRTAGCSARRPAGAWASS